MSAAEHHRTVAAAFTERVHGTRDWDVPAPVEGWTARDVVEHLVRWLPGLLAADGVELEPGPPSAIEPPARQSPRRPTHSPVWSPQQPSGRFVI